MSESVSRAGAFKRALNKRISILSLLSIPLTIGSFLGEWAYLFDLLSNFKLQLAYGLGALTCLNALTKNWKTVAWCFCLFLVIGGELLTWSLPYSGDAYGTRPLKIYYANVLTSNTRHDLLVNQLKEHRPDIIALVEVNSRWADAVSKVEGYPFSKVITRNDNFGIALYSKYELLDVDVLFFSKVRLPSISCKIKPEEKEAPIQVLVTHPLPPGSRQNAISRNGHLKSMAESVEKRGGRHIVLGDLNVTMWSPYYKKMEEVSGLYNSRQGFGVCPTWPSHLPTQIPLDHCLLSKDLKAQNFEVLESMGSDHFPFLVTVLY